MKEKKTEPVQTRFGDDIQSHGSILLCLCLWQGSYFRLPPEKSTCWAEDQNTVMYSGQPSEQYSPATETSIFTFSPGCTCASDLHSLSCRRSHGFFLAG